MEVACLFSTMGPGGTGDDAAFGADVGGIGGGSKTDGVTGGLVAESVVAMVRW